MHHSIRRGLGAWVLAALLLCSPSLVPGDWREAGRLITFPYRDDFDYKPSWSVLQGTWRYHDGLLNGTGDDAKTLAGNASWEDLVFTGKFRIVTGDEAGLLFHASGVLYEEDSGRYYYISNRIGGGVSLYEKAVGGKMMQKNVPFEFSRGFWYSFRIEVNASRVDYSINATPVLNFTGLNYPAGPVGLKAYFSTCHFDDIRVLDRKTGAVLFADGFPSNPYGGWDARKGTWAFGGTGDLAFVGTGDRDDLLMAPVTTPGTRWTARIGIMWTAGTYFETGLHFGYEDENSNYLAYLSARDSTLRIQRTDGGVTEDHWAQTAFPVKKGEWATFTIVNNGTGLNFYVNSAMVLNRTDPSPLPGAQFALGSSSNMQERVSFSFFEVLEGEVPPRPDLFVNLSALYVDPIHPNPGQLVDIRCNLDNIGSLNAASNYSVELLNGNSTLAVAFPDLIPVGKSVEIWFHWVANLTGNLTLTIAADRSGRLSELDETNNKGSFLLEVNIPPAASFVTVPSDGRVFVDQNLVLNATGSSDPDGTVATYLWNFGDRTFASVPVAYHVYRAAGTYQVTLNVTDNDGYSTLAAGQVLVRDREPTANITWSPVRGNITTTFVFRFQLYDPDNTLSGFRWDLGDGLNTADQAPAHRYRDDGTYNVTFTLLFNFGRNQTSVTREMVIDNIPPEASILSAPSELPKYQSGLFRACATDSDDLVSPLRFHWDFGDGTNASGPEAWHGFNLSGNYRVTLLVLDEYGLNSTLFVLVRVPNHAPNASFAQPPPGYLNTTFRFDASFSNDPDGPIQNYSWDFGDGEKSFGALAFHNYSTAGNYTVRLTVTDEEGATGTTTASLWVRPLPVPPRPAEEKSAGLPLLAIGGIIVLVFILVFGLIVGSRLRKGSRPPEEIPEAEQGPGGFQL